MAKSFAIATFNTLNLLHPGVFFAGRPNDKPYSTGVYEDKVEWIARVLKEGNVSLAGLQELFSATALNKVTTLAGFDHTYAPDIKDGKNITSDANDRKEAAGPFVGLISKYPIIAARTVVEFPDEVKGIEIQSGEAATDLKRLPVTRFQRPVIQADVRLRDDVTATVFVAHLKSKRPLLLERETGDEKNPIVTAAGSARSLIVRAAESIALRKLIVDATQDNQKPVILFGDLNDDLSAVTTQIIAGEEPFRFARLEDKKVEWDRLLYSVHDLEEQESYRDVSYTHIFNGRYELLDHIFVSQEFFHRNPDRIATVRNTRIFNDHLQDERRAVNPGRGPSRRSDHGIPVTEIEWQR
ncbi:endonuclease/exonuclease/phosphatase family protein [Sorangium sp. So ce381]|uniref:endonuclease/exonuclease/phosphatase family protein n=1 Tax=Sorangium sp. So ce381 TaxID=3133307 RepID=UPI003F5CB9B6